MASITEFSRLSAILTLDIAGFMRNSEIAKKQLVKFGTAATRVGQTLTRGLGLGLTLVGGLAVKTAAEFNKVSVQLRSLTDRASFKNLTEQSRLLGETTIFTRIQIAEAQKELAKLGTTGVDVEKILPGVAALAGALDEDLAGAASVVKEALNIYQLEAGKAQDVTDLFAQAVQSSALTIPQLREGLKNIGPILAKQNLSIEDTVALLALLSNSALKGSISGTKLRSTFNKLAKGGFIDANVSLNLLKKNTFDYAELLDLLNSRSVVVGAIVKDQADSLDELSLSFNNATGATTSLANEFEGELFYNVEQLKNAMQALAISIGTALGPQVEALKDFMIALARGFARLDPESKRFVTFVITAIPLVGAFVFVVGQLSIAFAAINPLTAAIVVTVGLLALAYENATREARAFENVVANSKSTLNTNQQILDSAEDQGLAQQVSQSKKVIDDASAKLFDSELLYSIRLTSDAALKAVKDLSGANGLINQKLAEAANLANAPGSLNVLKTRLRTLNEQKQAIQDQLDAALLLNYTANNGLTIQEAAEKKTQAELELENKRLQAEAQRLVNSKKLEQIIARIRKLSVDANIGLLPENEQATAKINAQFDEFAKKVKALGGSNTYLEKVREELLGIANASTKLNEQESLQSLIDSLAVLQSQGLAKDELRINQDIDSQIKALEGVGNAAEQTAILEEQRLIRLRVAREAAYDKSTKFSKDKLIEFSSFINSDLQNQIDAVTRAGEEIAAQYSAGSDERIAIEQRTADKIAEIRAADAQDQQQTALRGLRGVNDIAKQVGQSFSKAAFEGANFFETLKKSFLSFFQAIVAKLVQLVVLYGLLAILSGGTSASPTSGIGKLAQSAMGNNLGSFITSGFSVRSAQSGAMSGAFGSRIDGGDIVVSNQMSGRQMTRIGG